MEKRFNFDSIICSADHTKHSVFDVAAALTKNAFRTHQEKSKDCHWGIDTMAQLYLPAYPVACGSGDVASNFRFKYDQQTNNIVCGNWSHLLKEYKRITGQPVVVTEFHRDDRLRSIKMNEDGTINVLDSQEMKEVPMESKLFTQFLDSSSITPDMVQKMRKSSEGASYYSYLSDMLSFLNIINYHFNPDIFYKKTLQFEIIQSTDIDSKGKKKLTPVKNKKGKQWVPQEGFHYLYFKETMDKGTEDSMDYLFLNKENIPMVYQQLIQIISPEENNIKKLVRTFFSDINQFYRWSDYWVNDIDDALTIKMIIQCYNYTSLTEEEIKVKQQLMDLSSVIFS